MTKTIEEAAKEYYLNEVINGDTCDDKDGWTDCFVSGAKALMQLPLCDRLTAEEKERIKGTYKYHLNAIGDCYTHCMVRDELEHIFGKEMFEKE